MDQNKLITLNNKHCQFSTNDKSTFSSLRSFLSYKEAGIEYSPAFQRGGWNGIQYLLNKDGIFNSGLLVKVREFLVSRGVSFTEEDRRRPMVMNEPLDISAKLTSLNMVPRDYQKRIVDIACQNRKGIIRACTASGKSLCTALITAHFNKPTIIYVIGLDLLKQFHDLYSRLFDEEIGYIGNGECRIKRINIATIQTIGRALKLKNVINDDESNDDEKELDEDTAPQILKMLQNAKLHIFDESHVVATETIKQIYKYIDPENIYGFSGTPFREDVSNIVIHQFISEQIIDISASELIKRGILPQPIIKFVAIPSQRFESEKNYQTIYKEYIVENDVRNNIILKATKGLIDKNWTPLVLFKQIKHGKILLKLFQDAGIRCEMLNGNDTLERRTEVKHMLTNKEIDLVISSVIFDIGIDLPILNALILCGSGKSSIRSLQRIGRILRPFPDKKTVCVVDFFDQCRHLKAHSIARLKTYQSEIGFEIFQCDEMCK